jgi:hypothetical protein|tara:strand:- start:55 stop:273 length:219 start_codon:yes stop_codon:yes gene_type:complete
MRPETRANLGKQGAEIASVRGTLQGLAEAWGADAKYLQTRIADMEEKLTKIQNTLAEIEWSEEVDWTGKLNE